jgi:hypothetical protein
MLPANLFDFLKVGQSSPGIGPMEPSMPGYDQMSLLKDQEASDRAMLLQLLGTPPQMQAPPSPVNMAFRTPDAVAAGIAALATLLGGKKGGQLGGAIAQGWLSGKQRKAEVDTQVKQQNVGFQNQQAMNDYNAKLGAAKLQAGFSEDDVNDAVNQQRYDQTVADKKEYQSDVANAKLIDGLRRKFDQAKTLQQKRSINNALRQAEVKAKEPIVTALTDEQVEDAWREQSGARRSQIDREWRQYLYEAKRGNYGTIDADYAVTQLAPLKERFEKELQTYGLSPDEAKLPDPDTELSREAQYKNNLINKMSTELGLKVDESAQKILESKARVQRMKERKEHDDQTLGLSRSRYELQRQNQLIRNEVSKLNKQADGKINEIQAKINGVKAKMASEVSISKKREMQQQVDSFKAQRETWKSLKEEVPEAEVEKGATTSQEAAAIAVEIRRKRDAGIYTPEQAADAFEKLNNSGPASSAPTDVQSIRKALAAHPNKALGNAGIRAIAKGANAQEVYRRVMEGK